MRFGRTFPLAIVLISFLFAGSALAQEGEESGSDGAKPRWEVGGRFHFVTANPILGFSYDEHESVNGYTVGPVLSRRSADGKTRFLVGLDYTTTDPEDGPWLADGDDPPEAEWTEFRNFSVINANFIVGHVVKRGPFGFFFGGGLGLAIVSGSITTYGVTPDGENKLAGSEPDEKDIPPIVPTVLLKMGPQFELGNAGTISLDFGLHNGLFAGVSFTTGIPF